MNITGVAITFGTHGTRSTIGTRSSEFVSHLSAEASAISSDAMAGKSETASAQLPAIDAGVGSPRRFSGFQRPRHPPDNITDPPGIIFSATGRWA